MKYQNTTDCVSGRGRNAFVVEFFEVDFNVDEVVFVRLAVMNVEPNFRLKLLQDGTLQHEFMLCWNASAAVHCQSLHSQYFRPFIACFSFPYLSILSPYFKSIHKFTNLCHEEVSTTSPRHKIACNLRKQTLEVDFD